MPSLSAIAVATREKGNSVVDAYHQISQCMYVKRLLIQIKVEVSRKQNWFVFFEMLHHQMNTQIYELHNQFIVPSSILCPAKYLNYFRIETCFMTPPNVSL